MDVSELALSAGSSLLKQARLSDKSTGLTRREENLKSDKGGIGIIRKYTLKKKITFQALF